MISAVFWLAMGYLMGSCPTGYVLVKVLKGEDIRNFGSGNIGATNTGRVLGKPYAFVVAIVDMVKGGLAVAGAMICGVNDPWLLSAVGALAVIGHNYPVWLGFKGGKGVATTFGVIFFFNWFNPMGAIVGGISWYLVMRGTGYVSLASILSLYIGALTLLLSGAEGAYWLTALGLALLCTWRHNSNIARLLSGTESRLPNRFF